MTSLCKVTACLNKSIREGRALSLIECISRYDINSQFSRSRQLGGLGGLVPVHRLGVPLSSKAK